MTAVTDASGTVQARYDYTAYGSRTVLNPTTYAVMTDTLNFRQGFQGGTFEAAFPNLIFFRNRMFDTNTMRWVEEDPESTRYQDGFNLYAYEISNPIHNLDPSGTQGVINVPGGGAIPVAPPAQQNPFVPGMGTFTADVSPALDEFHSGMQIRFFPNSKACKQCDELSYIQRIYEKQGTPPGSVSKNFDVDNGDPYPHQTPWSSTGKNSGNPVVYGSDYPGYGNYGVSFNRWRYGPLYQYFQVTVICRKGTDAGKSYGTFTWFHYIGLGPNKDGAARGVEGGTMSSGPAMGPRNSSSVGNYPPVQ